MTPNALAVSVGKESSGTSTAMPSARTAQRLIHIQCQIKRGMAASATLRRVILASMGRLSQGPTDQEAWRGSSIAMAMWLTSRHGMEKVN